MASISARRRTNGALVWRVQYRLVLGGQPTSDVHFERGITIANGVSWVTFLDCPHERHGVPTEDEWAIKQFGADTIPGSIVVKHSTARLEASARHYLRAYAFQGRAIVLDRVNISGWGDGYGPSAIAGVRGVGKAHGCFVHDLPHHPYDGWPDRSGSHEDGTHPDAIQVQYGLDLLEVIGCRLPAPYTAGLLAKSNAASPITKLVVEDKWVVLEDPAGIGLNFLDMESGGAEDWSVKGNKFDMRLNPNRAADRRVAGVHRGRHVERQRPPRRHPRAGVERQPARHPLTHTRPNDSAPAQPSRVGGGACSLPDGPVRAPCSCRPCPLRR